MLVNFWILGIVSSYVLEVTDFLSGDPVNTWDLRVSDSTQAV